MVSTWVPLVQIETASIGGDSGGSWSNNNTKCGGFTFWTSRAKIRWGRIDQGSRCAVGGRRLPWVAEPKKVVLLINEFRLDSDKFGLNFSSF
eukprot:scaffold116650_cov30-Attheya_sp.AAC.2